jgi:hypothetical protein
MSRLTGVTWMAAGWEAVEARSGQPTPLINEARVVDRLQAEVPNRKSEQRIGVI